MSVFSKSPPINLAGSKKPNSMPNARMNKHTATHPPPEIFAYAPRTPPISPNTQRSSFPPSISLPAQPPATTHSSAPQSEHKPPRWETRSPVHVVFGSPWSRPRDYRQVD
ncbi:hypothetical protein K491DRAFT_687027 [Lophiostoma macrostomum CBS 122681]|uniref:Uncharacterized protein n=1 Tax=Lophiostoma macrostomum CBS 122681 TaxID=1314788 RepID=A0A6A6TQG4_9PLEO|nr:hypothetical protein K491DRAFT_687027 [Lophiostoma macrostomum CBS 122681]